jgi:hypothetical protein
MNTESFFNLLDENRDFIHKLLHVLCYRFFSDEFVLASESLYFRSINKYIFHGNLAQTGQETVHLCKYIFCTRCQMNRTKSGNRCMIWSVLTFKEKHEIDVSFADLLYFARAANTAHVSIDKDFQHLPWRRLIFLDMRICTVKL